MSARHGLACRIGQLQAWLDRVADRLEELSKLKREDDHIRRFNRRVNRNLQKRQSLIRTRGATRLLEEAESSLRQARHCLGVIHSDFEKDDQFLSESHLRLLLIAAAEYIRPVDQLAIAPLLFRTKSDPDYDVIVSELLRQLGITSTLAVTHHGHAGGLCVNTHFGSVAVFRFCPAGRCLDELPLLYHEIGHVVWNCVLTDKQQSLLQDEIFRFARECTRRSTLQTLAEIGADAFAGLVGGRPFATAFAASCLTDADPFTQPHFRYPSAATRVMLVRYAMRLADCPPSDLRDPIFDLWDQFVEAQFKIDPDARRAAVDEEAARDLIHRYAEILTDAGISLCSEIAKRVQGSATAPPDLAWSRPDIPALLLSAARYRASTDWKTYNAWTDKALLRLRRSTAGLAS